MAVLKVSRGLYTVTVTDLVDTLNTGAVSVNQVWTFQTTVFFNGNVDLGNTSADTVTVNGTALFNNNVTLGSSSIDIITVQGHLEVNHTADFNEDVVIGSSSTDIFTVNSQSFFNDDVTLGSAASDVITVNGTASFINMGDIIFVAGANITTSTTTGTIFGVSSSQKIGFWGATAVVRPPAWTITNAIVDRSFDANTVTLSELADVVATIIDDLDTMGLFNL